MGHVTWYIDGGTLTLLALVVPLLGQGLGRFVPLDVVDALLTGAGGRILRTSIQGRPWGGSETPDVARGRASLAGSMSISFSASPWTEDTSAAPAAATGSSTLKHNEDSELPSSYSIPVGRRWLNKGLLLSSFTDGLKSNTRVQDVLFEAVVENLWREEQAIVQDALVSSVQASPCNGPDPAVLRQLERIDNVVEELYHSMDADGTTGDVSTDGLQSSSSWREKLERLVRIRRERSDLTNNNNDDDGCRRGRSIPIEIRLLYIPTAMYALRKDSLSTPGTQRQRARADGKKRRTEMVELLQRGLGSVENGHKDETGREGTPPSFSILTVTLDLDDGSVKQPEGSDDGAKYPKTGMDAITGWKPHLIYIQGGNTFWLHHCMEKGGWNEALVKACCCCRYSSSARRNSDEAAVPASIYCGVSAGAIVVGNSMQTACWKEWDDPTVVPGRQSYDDWKNVHGLGLVGPTSFFPHMEEQWQSLVERKRSELPISANIGPTEESPSLCCLGDFDACFVDGKQQSIRVLSVDMTSSYYIQ